MQNKCLVCGKLYKTYKSRVNSKYCSKMCAGKVTSMRLSGNDNPRRKNKPIGELNPAWKGDNASYIAKHAFIYSHLGKPHKCEFCGTIERRLVWANIDHKYSRNLIDWKSLCYSCHTNYDIQVLNKDHGRRNKCL